jgi:Flp pilus assembly protein TadD
MTIIMKTRALVNLTLPVLLLAGGTVAVASARDAASDAKAAQAVAAKAGKALGKRDAARAVLFAEQAVQLSPHDAGHRALLGQSYLQAGRFASARATLEEAVQLDPRNGRAALNLVLAQIATGDWALARRTLDVHANLIPDGDRGLALALAGDPASAVGLLTQVARQPGAAVKTRQNLALALALAGQWQAAKVIAAADMSPADVDARMTEWAGFAQPRTASDQVAALLGVQAVADTGRPVTLALNAPAAAVATVQAPAVPTTAPVAPPPVVATVNAPPRIVFGARREVVQQLPVATIGADAAVAKVALTARLQAVPAAAKRVVASPAKGEFFVQLGAFQSVGVARDAWGRATRRFIAFQGRTPTGVRFAKGDKAFYRLSVGGFTRADAVATCRQYKAKGGVCFVRVGAGDQMAQWLRKPAVQLASR